MFWLRWCSWGVGRRLGPGSGGVVLCLCEVRVWILCVDGRSRYLCIVLGGRFDTICIAVCDCCDSSIVCRQSGPNKALPMTTCPKVLGLTLDPKLTYSTHIHNISVQAHTSPQIIIALTATRLGKQKETLMATYKSVMRPALEYASSIWSPLASSTSIKL